MLFLLTLRASTSFDSVMRISKFVGERYSSKGNLYSIKTTASASKSTEKGMAYVESRYEAHVAKENASAYVLGSSYIILLSMSNKVLLVAFA